MARDAVPPEGVRPLPVFDSRALAEISQNVPPTSLTLKELVLSAELDCLSQLPELGSPDAARPGITAKSDFRAWADACAGCAEATVESRLPRGAAREKLLDNVWEQYAANLLGARVRLWTPKARARPRAGPRAPAEAPDPAPPLE